MARPASLMQTRDLHYWQLTWQWRAALPSKLACTAPVGMPTWVLLSSTATARTVLQRGPSRTAALVEP